jgi:hypothetical protein
MKRSSEWCTRRRLNLVVEAVVMPSTNNLVARLFVQPLQEPERS